MIQWTTNVPEPFTHQRKDTTLLLGNGFSPLSVEESASASNELRIIHLGDKLNIELPPNFANGSRLAIFDELGREIWSSESKSQTESLDVSDLPSGTYYLRASKRNIVKTAVFIIAH